MIRFINIGNQIYDLSEESPMCFAWFCTITDTFLSFSDTQEWSSWEDFEKDYELSINNEYYDLERFKRLFPKEKK